MIKKEILLIPALFCFIFLSVAQEESKTLVSETFSNVHIINGHSTETLKKRQWRYIISHRFGDAAGDLGGVQTGFGFDNAADIRMGFDMGITDNLMIGVARMKGTSQPYSSILEGYAKYRFLSQNKDNSIPFSSSLTSSIYGTYMKNSGDITSVTNFDRFSHRLMYSSQLTIARKFYPRFSMALMPTFVHRNLVEQNDQNSLLALGAAARIRVTKTIGFIAEYFYSFSQEGLRQEYTNSLGVAMEWITNGHHFTLNFTNAKGFGELQYIALTQSEWLKGQFRFGFSISRTFKY